MKMKLTILLFCLISNFSYSECFTPTNLSATNINYYNADVNWSAASEAYNYRIRYRSVSAISWLYINNIDPALNITLLAGLAPLSDYIWQIMSYCDSTNTNISYWSVTDTFTTITNSCPNTSFLFTTNINYNNALANWDTILEANRYKLRYKILGTGAWSYLGPIYHPENNITIPLLLQNTSYKWQILTYHDTTTLLSSLWSISDTFMTTSFVAASFSPVITNTLGSLECNVKSELYLSLTQAENEPDIETSTISSDGGYFNISSINSGDSVGYATITTATQTIYAVLKVGIITEQNYAIINLDDGMGSVTGSLTIENINNGIKVSSTTPNDGNNYTSGFNSEIHFTNLYVTPQNEGGLHFFTYIESELGDQIYATDTFQIWCNTTNIMEEKNKKKIIAIYDVLGKKSQIRINTVQFVKLSDGTIERRVLVEK